jgi:hypothetical protein
MKIPCIDISTSLLYLSFKSEDNALLAKNEFWAKSKISLNERYCSKCENWHLFDSQGLGLTSNQRLTYKQTRYRERTGDFKGRQKCTSCQSSTGSAKTIFTDLQEAQNVIDSLSELLEYPLWAYKCPYGKGVHLTKSEHVKSIGLIKQKFLTKLEYEIEEVQSSKKLVKQDAHMKPLITTSKINEVVQIICKSCGYKLNLDENLKCAFCSALGPYEKVYR